MIIRLYVINKYGIYINHQKPSQKLSAFYNWAFSVKSLKCMPHSYIYTIPEQTHNKRVVVVCETLLVTSF